MLKNFLFLSISVFNLGNMGASVAMEQQHGRNSYGYPNMGYIQQNFSGNQYQQGYPHSNQVSLSQYNSNYPTPYNYQNNVYPAWRQATFQHQPHPYYGYGNPAYGYANPTSLPQYQPSYSQTMPPAFDDPISPSLRNGSSNTLRIETASKIEFYDRDKPFYEFTNFFDAPFDEIGQNYKNNWKTSEHYFQARKFNVDGARQVLEKIRDAEAPRDAFNLARTHSSSIRPNWHDSLNGNERESLKVNVMFDALNQKFDAHPALKALLLATDGLKIYECSPVDSYWGTGADDTSGTGTNMLGKLLEELRENYFGTLQSDKFRKYLAYSSPKEITEPTKSYLRQINRYDYFQYLLTNPQQIKGYTAFSLQGEKKPSFQKFSFNPSYQPNERTYGFNSRIASCVQEMFIGLPRGITVEREIKNGRRCIKVNFDSENTAKHISGLIDSELKEIQYGTYVDDRSIYVDQIDIDAFLGHFLKLDPGFIGKFHQQTW